MTKTLKNLMLASAGLMALAACSSDKDYYDPTYEYQQQKSSFERNFVSKFGSVSPSQTWDFSSMASAYATTRAEIVPQVQTEWYYVEQSSIDYFKNELEEGANNRAKGKPFIMSVPNNGFGIVPIHQGGAKWTWDLHMVIEQGGTTVKDVVVWEKHRDLECQLNDRTLQLDIEHNFGDGNPRNGETWYGTKDSYTWEPGGWWQNYEYGFNTMQAKAIRAKFIDFDNLPVGANIYFYLNVWDSQKDKEDGVEGRKESSLNQMMVALENVTRPTNIDEKNEVTIIGCEDNHGDDSDWDMNDLVFMVVGYPDVPKPVEIKNNQYDEIVSKRYMVEDLGSTDDFDFNDLVVDVREIRTHQITLTNGAKTNDVIIKTRQEATVRAMGGTLDFTLQIGDTKWVKSANGFTANVMYNTQGDFSDDTLEGNTTFDVTGWNPATNNISVTLKGKQSEYSVGFPGKGEVPMIIAFDVTKPWKAERESITKDWFDQK